MNIKQLAQKHNLSEDVVQHLADAMQRGNGTQAQFNHPALGGMGQWQNGMIMIGDAFNHALKAKIAAVCADLASAYQAQPQGFTPMSSMSTQQWWSAVLGTPSSTGLQNESAYAIFPDKQRVAIQRDGNVTIYATGTHRITGVSQQQSHAAQSLIFTTASGQTVSEADFTLVES